MIAKLLATALAMLTCLQLTLPGAQARDSAVRSSAGSGPQAGQTLASLAAYIKTQAPDPERTALALSATEAGHWQFVNVAGEPFTTSGAAEMSRAFRTLAPESHNRPEHLLLYLTDETVFRFPQQVRQLPDKATLRIVHRGSKFELKRQVEGASIALFAEIRPRLLIEIGERDLFDEAVAQLRRPVLREQLRTLALEPGGPTVIQRAPRPDPTSRRAATDNIDPSHLPRALKNLSGQIVLIFGRTEAGHLAYKPASGPDGNLVLADLAASAAAADVNLLVLGSSSPRQPGTRNWLWQRIEPSNIERASASTSLGEFLHVLAGDHQTLIVRASKLSPERTDLAIRPTRDFGQSAIGTITESVTGTWSDIVSETAGKVSITAIGASLLSRERQAELDRRFLPGIPSLMQLAYLGIVAAGLLAMPRLVAWWRRLWPPEAQSEYGNLAGYLLARTARGLAFALLYLPIAALPAFAASLTGWARNRLRSARPLLRPEPGNPRQENTG